MYMAKIWARSCGCISRRLASTTTPRVVVDKRVVVDVFLANLHPYLAHTQICGAEHVPDLRSSPLLITYNNNIEYRFSIICIFGKLV